jgi:hypothetical protein
VRPTALEVFRSMSSSKMVSWITGSYGGVAPRRTFAANIRSLEGAAGSYGKSTSHWN